MGKKVEAFKKAKRWKQVLWVSIAVVMIFIIVVFVGCTNVTRVNKRKAIELNRDHLVSGQVIRLYSDQPDSVWVDLGLYEPICLVNDGLFPFKVTDIITAVYLKDGSNEIYEGELTKEDIKAIKKKEYKTEILGFILALLFFNLIFGIFLNVLFGNFFGKNDSYGRTTY